MVSYTIFASIFSRSIFQFDMLSELNLELTTSLLFTSSTAHLRRRRTGAVVSVADYGPRGPWFET